jgi:predicted enzyme related to lactoylglutathione lyase
MSDPETPNPAPPGVTVEVCLDVRDPALVATFWSDLLGYRITDEFSEDWIHTDPPTGFPALSFQVVPEGKEGKNRLHFDVFVREPEAWINRAESLGATKLLLHDDPEDWFQVLADPEGNEFCICREREQRPPE